MYTVTPFLIITPEVSIVDYHYSSGLIKTGYHRIIA